METTAIPVEDKLTQVQQDLQGARNNLQKQVNGTEDFAAADAEVKRLEVEEYILVAQLEARRPPLQVTTSPKQIAVKTMPPNPRAWARPMYCKDFVKYICICIFIYSWFLSLPSLFISLYMIYQYI